MWSRSQIDHMHTDSCAMFVCVIVSIPDVSFQQSMFFLYHVWCTSMEDLLKFCLKKRSVVKFFLKRVHKHVHNPSYNLLDQSRL